MTFLRQLSVFLQNGQFRMVFAHLEPFLKVFMENSSPEAIGLILYHPTAVLLWICLQTRRILSIYQCSFIQKSAFEGSSIQRLYTKTPQHYAQSFCES